MARKKVIKTRIWEQPDFTESSGYILTDGGANKPTGKLTFEELGKRLGSNPLIIVFMPDGEGSYTMYRQTTFEMNVQPQFEPIDFAWLYQNVYKVMVCAAIIQGPPEHTGNPIFFLSGMYGDQQANRPYFEFTRFDTTEDDMVTEHSILVSTDAPYPFSGGNTIITDRYVNITSGDNSFIFNGSLNNQGEVICTTTYAEVKAAWDDNKTILLKLEMTYGDYQIWPMVDFNPESDMFIFHFPGDEQEFDSLQPNFYLLNKTKFEKEYIFLWKRSQGVDNRWQRCLLRLNDLNDYVPLSARNCGIGDSITASGGETFAQGQRCSADSYSLAQGSATSALNNSFAQGNTCIAVNNSFAQGSMCSAENGQAFGDHTVISGGLAVGAYNQISSNVAMVIGNGYYDSVNNSACRSDLFVVSADGTVSARQFVEAEPALTITGGDYVSVSEDSTNNKLIIDLESSHGQMITELSGVLTAKPSTGRHILGVDNGSLTWLEVNQ